MLQNNIWCGRHIHFDDEGKEMKKVPYIDPYIINTGIGSFDLWCGNHKYFDNEGREIKKIPYIDPYIKNTGIGSFNLWCGNHTYFDNSEDDKENIDELILDSITRATTKESCSNIEENYDLIYKTREIFDIDTNEYMTEVYTEKIYNL
tara:strand:- start:525 stop:968 length:444 start_codon:yes stop_codon:yes gene_type:complete